MLNSYLYFLHLHLINQEVNKIIISFFIFLIQSINKNNLSDLFKKYNKYSIL